MEDMSYGDLQAPLSVALRSKVRGTKSVVAEESNGPPPEPAGSLDGESEMREKAKMNKANPTATIAHSVLAHFRHRMIRLNL